MKTALVLGAGGFIGSHMVKRLRADGYWVRGVDLKYPEFSETEANEFVCMDLTDREVMRRVIRYGGERGNFYRSIVDKFLEPFDEIYQFAADMGGAGFIFTGDNDADIMRNSACINLNLLEEQRKWNEDKGTNHTKIFYSSSACMYPEHNQLDPDNPDCRESSAYPANPDSEYGWEKLFSERLYLSYHRNYNIPLCIARYHNIYGPEREIATGYSFADINAVFQCSSDMREKKYWETWQRLTFNPTTFDLGYYADYIGTVDIHTLDEQNKRRYGVRLIEAWPKSIGAQQLSYGTNDSYQTIDVTIAYRYWINLTDEPTTPKSLGTRIAERAINTVERRISSQIPSVISKLL